MQNHVRPDGNGAAHIALVIIAYRLYQAPHTMSSSTMRRLAMSLLASLPKGIRTQGRYYCLGTSCRAHQLQYLESWSSVGYLWFCE